ncbi:MAG: hypothetical protein PHV06_12475, partial [bacterium]|nr:hypothetical protein [bacterium]
EKAEASSEISLSKLVLDYKNEHIELEESIDKFFQMLDDPSIPDQIKNEEFGKFMADFTIHMHKEEQTLYKEYDKIP